MASIGFKDIYDLTDTISGRDADEYMDVVGLDISFYEVNVWIPFSYFVEFN